MVSASMGIELISEPFLIPVWFYGYSAIVYAISALISVFVMYFSYKFFRVSKTKSSMILLFSFLFLTMAFSSLTFTSLYTYLYKPYFKENFNIGSLSLVNSAGFYFYYVTSVVAYFSMLMMYLPGDLGKIFGKAFKKGLAVLYVPLWYLDLVDFHVASILIMVYVSIKTMTNFYKRRNVDNFLVMFSFLSIVSFHTCLLFVPFDPTIYLAANSLLIMGFTSLLLMLIRVSRSDKKKV